jgi:hypothetical protein
VARATCIPLAANSHDSLNPIVLLALNPFTTRTGPDNERRGSAAAEIAAVKINLPEPW